MLTECVCLCGSFDEHYRVYPVSFCDKAHLEDGDKSALIASTAWNFCAKRGFGTNRCVALRRFAVLLPPSALETLGSFAIASLSVLLPYSARLHIEYPMLFKVTNEGVERSSHCGVLEFSAPEGSCYMPYWMMQNLFVKEGGILNIQNVSLPKATFVKLRPQSQDFLDISNPRAVLEGSLRTFSCMTVGDTICLKYNNKNFMLDVREVKPAPAACIIETDCEVDFEAPADYVPPVPASASAATPPAAPSNVPYGGEKLIFCCILPLTCQDGGLTLVADEVVKPPRLGGAGFGSGLRLKKSGEKSATDAAALRAARLRKYEAFHGTGHSLSGKTSTFSSANASGSRLGGSSTGGYSLNGNGSTTSSSTAPAVTATKSMGHRLNGEAVNLKDEEETKDDGDEESKGGEAKDAVPFQGRGHRLR
ncbi:hypothetical protein BBJ28_00011500 [Nothophytophthora sp. Chile5]|nr:hypothetical protein BBJ28_00011500 [Nothophytophthora sp. Chile5]